MERSKHSVIGWIWRIGLSISLIMMLFILVLRFVPPPTTSFMLQSPYPVTQQWISIDQLPSHVPLAMVASEDQLFVEHYGIDLTSISQALNQQSTNKGPRGASTITQQTAKNLFLWSGRSYIRKGLEALIAISFEVLWGKKRILEVYLNVAEFGKGIYGVEAASQHYYNKSATKMTTTEAAKLAVLLPSPRKRSPNNLTPYLTQRVSWVKTQMKQLGANYLEPILAR